MDAPSLPTTVDELAEWSVYGDYLMSRGDPLGDLIAHDLALPADATRDQVKAFHELARRLCKQRDKTPVAWLLGQAYSLEVGMLRTVRMDRQTNTIPIASALDLLRLPRARRLVELVTDAPGWDDPEPWRALAQALPPTCRRIVLASRWKAPLERTLELVPPTVRELASSDVTAVATCVASGRFDLVELAGRQLDEVARHTLATAMAASSTRVRLTSVQLTRAIAGDLPWSRVVFVRPGDAALVGHGRAWVIHAPSLEHLQRRFGPVGVRAYLARALPEPTYLGAVSIVRHPGRWRMQPTTHEDRTVRKDGALVPPGEIVDLVHGDRVELDDRELEFVAGDVAVVEAACHRAVATASGCSS